MAALALPRRFYSFIWLLLLLAVALFFLSCREEGLTSLPRPPKSWRIPFTTDDGILSFMGYEREPVRISILESVGVHDEVAAALVHAFGGQENSELSLYFLRQRYGMEDIMSNFSLVAPVTVLNSSTSFGASMQELPPPDILVSTTCELDLERHGIQAIRGLLANATTHLFCVMHHADHWVEGKHVREIKPWVEEERVDFIALSQHTGDFLLNNTVPQWNSNATITARTFPPVFPVKHPEPNPAGELSLAMQGDYSSGRRDYKGIFNHLGTVIRKVNESTAQDNKNVSLHVIGHGKPPEVPEAVRSNVVFDHDLSYPDFYAILSRAYAMVPAFASDTYLDRKASSTVPASLIAGAPMVASEEILAAYSYLPRDAVWISQPGEDEMDVIERVIEQKDEFLRKRERTRAACNDLMEENRGHVKEWIDVALEKARAAN